MNWETLLCFGDSITAGARSYLSYPDYTASYLSERLNKKWNSINFAFNGFTTIELARAIDNQFINLKSLQPLISTLLIGTNDLKSNTSPQHFKIAYELLVLKAMLLTTQHNLKLILIPDLPAGVMYPYNYDMNTLLAEYNNIIKEVANKNHLCCIEFQLRENDLFDGVHLSESGSENCGKQLAEIILAERGIV